jgi:hypothetical protein
VRTPLVSLGRDLGAPRGRQRESAAQTLRAFTDCISVERKTLRRWGVKGQERLSPPEYGGKPPFVAPKVTDHGPISNLGPAGDIMLGLARGAQAGRRRTRRPRRDARDAGAARVARFRRVLHPLVSKQPLPAPVVESLVVIPLALVGVVGGIAGLWSVTAASGASVYMAWPRGDRFAPGGRYAAAVMGLSIGVLFATLR